MQLKVSTFPQNLARPTNATRAFSSYAYFLLLFYASNAHHFSNYATLNLLLCSLLWTEFEDHLNHIHKYKIPSPHN